MIEDLFDHACNIYHLISEAQPRKYGLPEDVCFNYPDVPDIKNQICHFGVKVGNIQVVNGEPQKDLDARLKLCLPIGTDIRVNDKVISANTGYSYVAEVPRNIRGHHIIVYVNRQDPKAI